MVGEGLSYRLIGRNLGRSKKSSSADHYRRQPKTGRRIARWAAPGLRPKMLHQASSLG
jgi:hypothetical protein